MAHSRSRLNVRLRREHRTLLPCREYPWMTWRRQSFLGWLNDRALAAVQGVLRGREQRGYAAARKSARFASSEFGFTIRAEPPFTAPATTQTLPLRGRARRYSYGLRCREEKSNPSGACLCKCPFSKWPSLYLMAPASSLSVQAA